MARKSDNKGIIYDENIMRIAIALYKKSEITVEILYHLIMTKRIDSFSAIIVNSKMEDFGDFLKEQKRKTDLLFELDSINNVYGMFCQETQVDGGFYFMRRLQQHEKLINNKIYASIVGVETTHYPHKDLIFIILDSYIKLLNSETGDTMLFKTIK
jgi:hypothetical protein